MHIFTSRFANLHEIVHCQLWLQDAAWLRWKEDDWCVFVKSIENLDIFIQIRDSGYTCYVIDGILRGMAVDQAQQRLTSADSCKSFSITGWSHSPIRSWAIRKFNIEQSLFTYDSDRSTNVTFTGLYQSQYAEDVDWFVCNTNSTLEFGIWMIQRLQMSYCQWRGTEYIVLLGLYSYFLGPSRPDGVSKSIK